MDFTPNRTLPTFYDYIPVYKSWIQYTNLFKRYWTEIIFVRYRQDGTDRTYIRTDRGDNIWSAPPHPLPPAPTENGRGIKTFITISRKISWKTFIMIPRYFVGKWEKNFMKNIYHDTQIFCGEMRKISWKKFIMIPRHFVGEWEQYEKYL